MNSRDGGKESRGAVYGEEVGEFVRFLDVAGLGLDTRMVEFEQKIAWLRETETHVVVAGPTGRELKRSSTHSDFYGFMSSMSEVGLPGFLLREFAVESDGPLVVSVLVSVKDEPVVEDTCKEPFYKGARSLRSVPNDWMRKDLVRILQWKNTPTPERYDLPPEKCPEWLRPREEKVVIWSSDMLARPQEEQLRITGERLAAMTTGLPPSEREAADRRIAVYLDDLAKDLKGELVAAA